MLLKGVQFAPQAGAVQLTFEAVRVEGRNCIQLLFHLHVASQVRPLFAELSACVHPACKTIVSDGHHSDDVWRLHSTRLDCPWNAWSAQISNAHWWSGEAVTTNVLPADECCFLEM